MNLIDLARSSLQTTERTSGTPSATHFRWRVAIPGRVFEVRTSPEMTAAEVRDLYRGADVQPMAVPIHRTPTVAERAELCALVRRILPNEPEEWDEAVRIAAADPEAALTSFRLLANTAGPGDLEGRNER